MSGSVKDERAVFLEAVGHATPEARAAYVQSACGGDTDLRKRVEQLLVAHDESRGPLDCPPPVAMLPPSADRPLTEGLGAKIGPFKLLQELGKGGMGVVYMAEQSEPVSRRVALKVIKPGMDTGQVIARFEAERQALAMMDHPNIAKVLDAGATDSGRPYFVMELVMGIPITQYCDEQHLAPKHRLELFIQVCQAVQHAHQKGIIHRDIKPSNVLVAEYDQKAVPKVIDFGVAKATSQKLTAKTMFTQFGQIVGTLEYMSPEQAKLNQLDIDTRSDVYSLGVLLYELLTGDTPFDRKRLHSAAFEEMLRIIREEEPPRPSTRLSSMSDRKAIAKCRAETPDHLDRLIRGDLDWIAMKALEKDRGRRYATASSLADDVERFLHDEVIDARPPSRRYQLGKFVRRNKGPFAAAVGVMAALILGMIGTSGALVFAIRERARANENEQQARSEAERATQANEKALQIIMQDALSFAMSGDKERTENFIERARVVGASEAQLELIRGAVSTGSDARRKFHRVIELDPHNLTARVLLGFEYLQIGEFDKFARSVSESVMLEPKTPEDIFFRGSIMLHAHPEQAASIIRQALNEHDSGLARMVYSMALAKQGLVAGDERLLAEAVQQARSAHIYMGNASAAAGAHLQAVDRSHYLAQSSGATTARLAELRSEGDTVAEQILASTTPKPMNLMDCALHYEFVNGDQDRAEQVWRRAVQDGIGIYGTYFAAFRLRYKGPASSLEIHDQLEVPGNKVAALLFSRCLLLAMNGETSAAELAVSDLENSNDFPVVMPAAAAIPLMLGDRERAQRWLQRSDNYNPFLPGERPSIDVTTRFFTDDIGPEEFAAEANGPEELTCIHFIIALKALAEDDRQTAMKHFELSVDAAWPFHEYHVPWSAAFLAQMKRDPNWPVVRGQSE